MNTRELSQSQHRIPEDTGLTVVFLHHNRPWSLEIAVKTLKRALMEWQIPHQLILADDGSDGRLYRFFDSLECDEILMQSPTNTDKEASVYYTLEAAYQKARNPFILHVEDDFWFVPQGFSDREKCHIDGLSSIPVYQDQPNIVKAAMQVLDEVEEAHVIELARSFSNERYITSPHTEGFFCNIPFQAKIQSLNPRFYTCAWPHMMRTDEQRAIQLPAGCDCWDGEMKMGEALKTRFGSGDWVYMPERCYFAHINIFTWREHFNRSVIHQMQWTGTESTPDLPFRMERIGHCNEKLLEAFIKGEVKNDMEMFFTIPAMEYVYRMFYEKVK